MLWIIRRAPHSRWNQLDTTLPLACTVERILWMFVGARLKRDVHASLHAEAHPMHPKAAVKWSLSSVPEKHMQGQKFTTLQVSFL